MTDQTLMTASPDDSTAASDGVGTTAAEATEETTQTQQDGDTAATEGEDKQTEGDKSKEGEDKADGDDDDDDSPEGAPEEYEDFTAPEGVELDADVLSDFKGLAKELNLPQAQAQKIVDVGVQLSQKWAEQSAAAVEAMQSEWLEQAKTDKEFGGEALNANLAIGKKALDTFGTDELRGLLEQSKLGDHPEIIRFFTRVGKAISEDSVVTPGGEPKSKPKGLAERIFDNPSQS